MPRVGFLYWSPGLIGDFSTADPSWVWLSPLFKQLRENGIESRWLDPSTLPDDLLPASIEDVDMVFCYWRWLLPDTERYRPRNEAYGFQMEAISKAAALDKPIVVFDGDLKMKPSEKQWLQSLRARLVMPAFYPYAGYETLMYPMVWPVGNVGSHERRGVTYIGNNYERYGLAKQYLSFASHYVLDPEVSLYGNWLEPSRYRESPQRVSRDFPRVAFKGVLDQRYTIEILRDAKATVHIAKPEYCDTGFIALRWFEAVAAGTAAFIPIEWRLPKSMHRSTNAVHIATHVQQPEYLSELLVAQQNLIASMTFEPWLKLFGEMLSSTS